MDCIGRAGELAGLRGLTVWKQRVEAGRGSDRTDSGHEVADSSGQVGRGFSPLPCWFLLGCAAEFHRGPRRAWAYTGLACMRSSMALRSWLDLRCNAATAAGSASVARNFIAIAYACSALA